jgi:hypothetical protein
VCHAPPRLYAALRALPHLIPIPSHRPIQLNAGIEFRLPPGDLLLATVLLSTSSLLLMTSLLAAWRSRWARHCAGAQLLGVEPLGVVPLGVVGDARDGQCMGPGQSFRGPMPGHCFQALFPKPSVVLRAELGL